MAAKTVLLSTGAEYRRLPVDDLEEYEGLSVFYAAGPPEAQLCGARRVGVGVGGNSAAQAPVSPQAPRKEEEDAADHVGSPDQPVLPPDAEFSMKEETRPTPNDSVPRKRTLP